MWPSSPLSSLSSTAQIRMKTAPALGGAACGSGTSWPSHRGRTLCGVGNLVSPRRCTGRVRPSGSSPTAAGRPTSTKPNGRHTWRANAVRLVLPGSDFGTSGEAERCLLAS